MPKPYLTPEQYLEIERAAEFRSEYHLGEMFAMAGATMIHGQLIMNAGRELSSQFRGKPCQVISTDLRVRVRHDSYTYPDLVALCGQPELLDQALDTLLNPSVIVEVLSPSTEAYDRGRKFDLYKAIESLREYVLVASDRVHIDRFTRTTDGAWLLTSYDALTDTVGLESVGASLLVADLYDKVKFEAV